MTPRLLIAAAAPLVVGIAAGAPLVAAELTGAELTGAEATAAEATAAAAPSSAADEAEPCHEGHCHGPEKCNGVWKDYRERAQAVGPKAGAATAEAACKQTVDELTADAEARAAARCN